MLQIYCLVFGGSGEGGIAWTIVYKQICQNEAGDIVSTGAHAAVWRTRSSFHNTLIKGVAFLVYWLSSKVSIYLSFVLHQSKYGAEESALLFPFMPRGEEQWCLLQMQSRELLLKNTQFLLAFHALCAKMMELVFDTWCDEGLLWPKKEKSV